MERYGDKNKKLLNRVTNYYRSKSRKKYLTKSINFGGVNDPARILIEEYIKKNGDMGLSKFIRELVINYLSPKKEFKDYKVNLLIEQRKTMGKEVQELSKKLKKNADGLERLGIDLDKI